MKCDLECDFHDSDKMPKHVEMVRTKCQPKSWERQNANHRNKSGQNANLWLALCPVGILSDWHFVRLAFCPHTFWCLPLCLQLLLYHVRPDYRCTSPWSRHHETSIFFFNNDCLESSLVFSYELIHIYFLSHFWSLEVIFMLC